MIKAKDLRVGNKLLFGFNKEPDVVITVAWVSSDSIGYLEQHEASYPQSPKDFEGIPLTAEWLEKMGFVRQKAEFDSCFDKGSMSIHQDGTFFFPISYETHEPDFQTIGTGFKHVHQLQNLYFALTGEELTIKN